VGTLANNLNLLHRRAGAVARVLTAKYQIGAARLTAQGLGPSARWLQMIAKKAAPRTAASSW
jgi:outer membrane protein OmpA-like peptidoglycan-associated protein